MGRVLHPTAVVGELRNVFNHHGVPAINVIYMSSVYLVCIYFVRCPAIDRQLFPLPTTNWSGFRDDENKRACTGW